MDELFADLPEALANTAVIAQRCAVAAPKRRPILPRLGSDEDEQLRSDAKTGLDERLKSRPAEERQVYQDRLDYEAPYDDPNGFRRDFLIVSDFIKWAKTKVFPLDPAAVRAPAQSSRGPDDH